jgi:hypothetical protein
MIEGIQAKQWINRFSTVITLVLVQNFTMKPTMAQTVNVAQTSPPLSVQASQEQSIKVRLGVSGVDNEWIRIDGNLATGTLTVYHTTRVRQALLSDVATALLGVGAGALVSEAIDGYNGPVPTPNLNFHRWVDHQTRRLLFVPDDCSEASSTPERNLPSPCTISGTNTIALPPNTNIRAGTWTIEYTEETLIRTIAFRIPKT